MLRIPHLIHRIKIIDLNDADNTVEVETFCPSEIPLNSELDRVCDIFVNHEIKGL